MKKILVTIAIFFCAMASVSRFERLPKMLKNPYQGVVTYVACARAYSETRRALGMNTLA